MFINGIETKALLDTGRCVSTCSKSFYENNLGHLKLMPLDNLVKLESANGEHIWLYTGRCQTEWCPIRSCTMFNFISCA